MRKVKHQIKDMEQRLRFDRIMYVEKRIAYKKQSDKLKYLWLLLPISAFVVGFRRNIVIVSTLVAFLKSQAFFWLRQNVQSKLILTLFR